MPLLTITERANAQNAALAESVMGDLQSAIKKTNSMASGTMALSNAHLSAWLNARPWPEREAEFMGHYLLGSALNSAAAVCEANMELPEGSIGRVDLRPVPEKLAAAYRAIVPDEATGLLLVIDLPRPEPEPVTEEEEQP